MFSGNDLMMHEFFKNTETISLPGNLREFVDDGFFVDRNCIIFRRFAESAKPRKVEEYGDRTGFEGFINHIHLEDYPNRWNIRKVIGFSYYVAEIFYRDINCGDPVSVINKDGGHYIFRLYLSRNDEPSFLHGNLDEYNDSPLLSIKHVR